jgi:hypothetical protein
LDLLAGISRQTTQQPSSSSKKPFNKFNALCHRKDMFLLFNEKSQEYIVGGCTLTPQPLTTSSLLTSKDLIMMINHCLLLKHISPLQLYHSAVVITVSDKKAMIDSVTARAAYKKVYANATLVSDWDLLLGRDSSNV